MFWTLECSTATCFPSGRFLAAAIVRKSVIQEGTRYDIRYAVPCTLYSTCIYFTILYCVLYCILYCSPNRTLSLKSAKKPSRVSYRYKTVSITRCCVQYSQRRTIFLRRCEPLLLWSRKPYPVPVRFAKDQFTPVQGGRFDF
jgi:hypothetical protein